MSEPIRLWDKSGALWITYSPSAAAAAIEAGTHTLEQPVKPNLIDDAVYSQSLGEPTPFTHNDTQEVPVVPTGRARRRDKGDGGVL